MSKDNKVQGITDNEILQIMGGYGALPLIDRSEPETYVQGRVDLLVAAIRAVLDKVVPAGSIPVQFMGMDPFAIGKGAVHPMIPDSWRYGFVQTDRGVLFTAQDNGSLMAYGAHEDAMLGRIVPNGWKKMLDRVVPRIDANNPVPLDEEVHHCEHTLYTERERIHAEFAKIAPQQAEGYCYPECSPTFQAMQAAEVPRIRAVFRTESDDMIGTTDAPIHSVSVEDDGSYTVAIDHWPTPNNQPAQPNFEAVAGKRMCDLTPEQQEDAYELWLRNNIAYMPDYHRKFYDMLLKRLDTARERAIPPVIKLHIPVKYAAERANWTYGQWADHFGGRHKDNNPMNYYEFGSFWAVAKMLNSYGFTQRQVGWNLCHEAVVAVNNLVVTRQAEDEKAE